MPKEINNGADAVDAALERITNLKTQVGSGSNVFGLDQAATDLVLATASGNKRIPETVYRCNFDALIQQIHSNRSQYARLVELNQGGDGSTDTIDNNEALDPSAQDDAIESIHFNPFEHKRLSIYNPNFKENARLYIKMCESGIFGTGKADASLIAILKQQLKD
ncbi:hypothetical protein JW758_05660 [Candidatus Peregrinibacteria bacterium]|nr:hypothetical protein [Candidatus Peregrinibacteria bacterium]